MLKNQRLDIISYPKNIKRDGKPICFMAGGCADTEWQAKFILTLKCFNPDMYLIDPYNPKIKDAKKQIEWEFKYLNDFVNDNFIFSIYFDRFTKQPISMYELGRASVLCKPTEVMVNNVVVTLTHGFTVVVSIHEESPIKDDVLIQCELAGIKAEVRTPEEHAKEVYNHYRIIRSYGD